MRFVKGDVAGKAEEQTSPQKYFQLVFGFPFSVLLFPFNKNLKVHSQASQLELSFTRTRDRRWKNINSEKYILTHSEAKIKQLQSTGARSKADSLMKSPVMPVLGERKTSIVKVYMWSRVLKEEKASGITECDTSQLDSIPLTNKAAKCCF